MERLTGRRLNDLWQAGARHALYNKNGNWYHRLREFPAALLDRNGYLRFETETEYEQCRDISIGPEPNSVHVANGIASINGYVRVRDLS